MSDKDFDHAYERRNKVVFAYYELGDCIKGKRCLIASLTKGPVGGLQGSYNELAFILNVLAPLCSPEYLGSYVFIGN